MNYTEFQNPLFKIAVATIDTGNVAAFKEILNQHPQLINEQAHFVRKKGSWKIETYLNKL